MNAQYLALFCSTFNWNSLLFCEVVLQSWIIPGQGYYWPVEQEQGGHDWDDAQGSKGGDREDDGEVDDDDHGADHEPDDREHVDNQPGDEVVSE